MVSAVSILAMVITLLICFGVPAALFLYMYQKERIHIVAVLVGALVFLVSQVFIRIPILGVLSNMNWYQRMAANLFIFALFLGLTAGIFEEVGRYLGFRFLLKRHLSWKNGVAFGIGHGGIEAIVLVGLTYVNNLILSAFINLGLFDRLIVPQIGREMADEIVHVLIHTPAYMYLFAGLERINAIFFHVALSLVVLMALTRNRLDFVLCAVLLHAAVNMLAVLIPDPLLVQLYLLAIGVVSVVFIILSRRLFPSTAA